MTFSTCIINLTPIDWKNGIMFYILSDLTYYKYRLCLKGSPQK